MQGPIISPVSRSEQVFWRRQDHRPCPVEAIESYSSLETVKNGCRRNRVVKFRPGSSRAGNKDLGVPELGPGDRIPAC